MSQQINLFNPAFEPQRALFTSKTMALAAGVMALGVVALAGLAQLRIASLEAEASDAARQLARAQKRLETASAEFTPVQKDPSLPARFADVERQHAALQRAGEIIERGDLGNTHGDAEYFRALARQTGDGLWLTGVTIDGAGREIGLKGRAMDPALVPGFLNRLRNEPVLQGKIVGSLRIDEPAQLKPATVDGKDKAVPPPWVEFSVQSAPAGAKP